MISEARLTIAGRERDVREVRNYWNALLRVEEWAAQGKPLTEELIRRLHALVEHGARGQTDALPRWAKRDSQLRHGRHRLSTARSKGCAGADAGAGGLGQPGRTGRPARAAHCRPGALPVRDHPPLLRRQRPHGAPPGYLHSPSGAVTVCTVSSHWKNIMLAIWPAITAPL